jgi:tricorn protease
MTLARPRARRAAGRDPQLEKAIEIVLQKLKEAPPRPLQRPPFPVRALP